MGSAQLLRLGDVCRFQTGSVFKSELQGRSTGELPFIKVSDMNLPGNERQISTANHWVMREDLSTLKARPVSPPAVVFAKIGEALKQNRKRLLTRDTLIDNNMMAAIPDAHLVDSRFFYYALIPLDFASVAGGTALPYLTVAALQEIPIRIPDLHKQREIAQILGAFDDKIELNRRMNETLEEMARALFKCWFVDFEPVRLKAKGIDPSLPPEKGLSACGNAQAGGLGLDPEIAALFPDSFVDSELGEIPKGWAVKPLDEVADFLNGLAMQKHPAKPDDPNSLPVIKIAQLRSGNTQSADRASRTFPDEYLVKDGDLVFSWSGSLEVVFWAGGEGALNQHLFKVSSMEYPTWFYYHWLLHHLPTFRQIAAGKATTMGHIQRHHLTQALAVVPDKRLTTAADNVFAPLVRLIVANAVNNGRLAATRDALLPKLISGEMDIFSVKSEKQIEEKVHE